MTTESTYREMFIDVAARTIFILRPPGVMTVSSRECASQLYGMLIERNGPFGTVVEAASVACRQCGKQNIFHPNCPSHPISHEHVTGHPFAGLVVADFIRAIVTEALGGAKVEEAYGRIMLPCVAEQCSTAALERSVESRARYLTFRPKEGVLDAGNWFMDRTVRLRNGAVFRGAQLRATARSGRPRVPRLRRITLRDWHTHRRLLRRRSLHREGAAVKTFLTGIMFLGMLGWFLMLSDSPPDSPNRIPYAIVVVVGAFTVAGRIHRKDEP